MNNLNIVRYPFFAFSFAGAGITFGNLFLLTSHWSRFSSDGPQCFSLALAVFFLGGLVTVLISVPKALSSSNLFLYCLTLALSLVTVLAIPWVSTRSGESELLFRTLSLFLAQEMILMILLWSCLSEALRHGNKPLAVLTFGYAGIGTYLTVILNVLIPYVGYPQSNWLVATLTVLFTSTIFFHAERSLRARWIVIFPLILFPLVYKVPLLPEKTSRSISSSPDTSRILEKRQSLHRTIVLREEQGVLRGLPGLLEHTLSVDRTLLFSSQRNELYHLCLSDTPVLATHFFGKELTEVLIIGGASGLLVRNLLTTPSLKGITVVEKDPLLIQMARTTREMRVYNLDSLSDKRVQIITTDPYDWVRTSTEKDFPLILIDLPPPQDVSDNRFFTVEFYASLTRLLTREGILSIRVGPALKDTANAMATLSAIGLPATPYFNVADKESFILSTNNTAFNPIAFFNKHRTEHCTDSMKGKLERGFPVRLSSPRKLEIHSNRGTQ